MYYPTQRNRIGRKTYHVSPHPDRDESDGKHRRINNSVHDRPVLVRHGEEVVIKAEPVNRLICGLLRHIICRENILVRVYFQRLDSSVWTQATRRREADNGVLH
jgi:hypothetical protein